MSLIESAIRRAKVAANDRAGAVPTRRVIRKTPANPAEAAGARTFQTCSVDVVAMERYGVLQEVSDKAALRAYKILRTRVLQRLASKQWHSLATTAAGAGEGKTLTSINLAITLAQDVNTWVFLVDLDLQRPKIGEYLGMNYEFGMSHYLAGEAELDQVIYNVGIDRLAVIPNAQSVHNSSELLGSPRMAEFQAALAAEVPRRVIIYDMPPIMMSDDVLAFSPYVDSLLLVVAEGSTGRSALEDIREVLAEMNLLGVVLNRSSEQENSSYY